ncbi:MAG: endonuclease VII domain-containing protein [Acidimicrobiia bacterium]
MTDSVGPHKVCCSCDETKSLNEFYANPSGRDGTRPECKVCTKARRREWYASNREREIERVTEWQRANPDRVKATMDAFRAAGRKKLSDRKSHLKRNYGLTLDQYEEMLAAQGGVCAICRQPRPEDRTLHVDHDHETGEIRGLLCFKCNNALGDFNDDHDLFQTAADYLDRDTELTEMARSRARALAL